MRVSDSEQYDMTRFQMEAQSQRLYQLRQEAASGRKNLQASDDPSAYARALFLQNARVNHAAFDEAAQRARDRLSAYDQSVATIHDALGAARSLAMQGASDSTDPSVRGGLASNVDDLLGRLMSLANGNEDGRYVYGGSRTDKPPFVATRTNGLITSVQYVGDSRTQDVGLENGDSVRASVSAAEVFGTPADGSSSLMSTLIELRDALNGGDRATSGALADRLDQQMGDLAATRGEIGTRQQHLDALAKFRQSTVERLDLELSSVQEADLPATITRLTQQELAFQGALQVAARLGKNSLLDYLR